MSFNGLERKHSRMGLLERKRSRMGILKRKTSSLSLRRKASRRNMRRRRTSRRTSSSRSLNSYVEKNPRITDVSPRIVCLTRGRENSFLELKGYNLGVDKRKVFVRFLPLSDREDVKGKETNIIERGVHDSPSTVVTSPAATPSSRVSTAAPQILRPIAVTNEHLRVGLPSFDHAVHCLLSVSRDNGQSYHPSDLDDIKFLPKRLRHDIFVVALYNEHALKICSISPSIGSCKGGTEVTITGSGFLNTGCIKVRVSDGNSNIFFCDGLYCGPTEIRFTTPVLRQEEPTIVLVEVTLDGNIYTRDYTLYVYNHVPVIDSLSSHYCSMENGGLLTLKGKGIINTGTTRCRVFDPSPRQDKTQSTTMVSVVMHTRLDLSSILRDCQESLRDYCDTKNKWPDLTLFNRPIINVLERANQGSLAQVHMPSWKGAGKVHVSVTVNGQEFSSQPIVEASDPEYEDSAISRFVRAQNVLAEPKRRRNNRKEQTERRLASTGNGEEGLLSPLGRRSYVIRPAEYVLTYVPQYYVSAITPVCGPARGGTVLTISGGGFTETGEICVHFVSETEHFSSAAKLSSEKSVQVTTPKDIVPGTYQVSVHAFANMKDSSTQRAPMTFRCYERPSCISLLPNCTPSNVSTQLSIIGANLSLCRKLCCVYDEQQESDSISPTEGRRMRVKNDVNQLQLPETTAPGGHTSCNGICAGDVTIRLTLMNAEKPKSIFVPGKWVAAPPPPQLLESFPCSRVTTLTKKKGRIWNSIILCEISPLLIHGKWRVAISYNRQEWHTSPAHFVTYEEPEMTGVTLVKKRSHSKCTYFINIHTRNRLAKTEYAKVMFESWSSSDSDQGESREEQMETTDEELNGREDYGDDSVPVQGDGDEEKILEKGEKEGTGGSDKRIRLTMKAHVRTRHSLSCECPPFIQNQAGKTIHVLISLSLNSQSFSSSFQERIFPLDVPMHWTQHENFVGRERSNHIHDNFITESKVAEGDRGEIPAVNPERSTNSQLTQVELQQWGDNLSAQKNPLCASDYLTGGSDASHLALEHSSPSGMEEATPGVGEQYGGSEEYERGSNDVDGDFYDPVNFDVHITSKSGADIPMDGDSQFSDDVPSSSPPRRRKRRWLKTNANSSSSAPPRRISTFGGSSPRFMGPRAKARLRQSLAIPGPGSYTLPSFVDSTNPPDHYRYPLSRNGNRGDEINKEQGGMRPENKELAGMAVADNIEVVTRMLDLLPLQERMILMENPEELKRLRQGDVSILLKYFRRIPRTESRRESREGIASNLVDYRFHHHVHDLNRVNDYRDIYDPPLESERNRTRSLRVRRMMSTAATSGGTASIPTPSRPASQQNNTMTSLQPRRSTAAFCGSPRCTDPSGWRHPLASPWIPSTSRSDGAKSREYKFNEGPGPRSHEITRGHELLSHMRGRNFQGGKASHRPSAAFQSSPTGRLDIPGRSISHTSPLVTPLRSSDTERSNKLEIKRGIGITRTPCLPSSRTGFGSGSTRDSSFLYYPRVATNQLSGVGPQSYFPPTTNSSRGSSRKMPTGEEGRGNGTGKCGRAREHKSDNHESKQRKIDNDSSLHLKPHRPLTPMSSAKVSPRFCPDAGHSCSRSDGKQGNECKPRHVATEEEHGEKEGALSRTKDRRRSPSSCMRNRDRRRRVHRGDPSEGLSHLDPLRPEEAMLYRKIVDDTLIKGDWTMNRAAWREALNSQSTKTSSFSLPFDLPTNFLPRRKREEESDDNDRDNQPTQERKRLELDVFGTKRGVVLLLPPESTGGTTQRRLMQLL